MNPPHVLNEHNEPKNLRHVQKLKTVINKGAALVGADSILRAQFLGEPDGQ